MQELILTITFSVFAVCVVVELHRIANRFQQLYGLIILLTTDTNPVARDKVKEQIVKTFRVDAVEER